MNLAPYQTAVWAAAMTLLMWGVQFMVADVARILAKTTPGVPVAADHARFAFRAERAWENTNESLPAYSLALGLALFSRAEPTAVAGATVAYLGLRLLHMVAYYLRIPALRIAAFIGSMLALGTLVGAVLVQLALSAP